MSRHHHHDPAPPPCCSCCACACSPPAPPPCYYPAPPPQPAAGSDQLLHAIAAHLLLSTAPPPPPQPQPQAQPPPQPQHQPQPPPNPATHHANLYASYAYQHHQQQQQQGSAPHAAYPQPPAAAPAPPPQQHQHQQPNPPDHGQLLLHSLLRRVAALETTLPHVLPSHPAPHPQQPNPRRHHRAHAHAHQKDPRSPSPPPRRARRGPPSERELAARTIQEHFRRFLARRSRTLRQLKELAMLRSKAASLRASLSGSGRRRCKDPMAVSEVALGMLYRLDRIQGGDPMIREGKHAVSRELGRILEFVDKVLLREQEEMGVDGAFDDYPEGCHGMNRPTVDRKVSFRGNEATNEADESSESSSSADANETKAANSKKSANGKPGLAAPMPVHMESRRTGGEM